MGCSSCQKNRVVAPASAPRSAKSFAAPSDGTDLYLSLASIPVIGAREPVLRNWKYRPPAGGWAVSVSINGIHSRFDGSPVSIAQNIHKGYKNAGREIPMERVWDFLNMTWRARDPNRVISPPADQVKPEPPPPNAHLATSPATFGPSLWSAMSLFGMKDHFDKQAWVSVSQYVTRLLDPATNPAGCAECYETWTAYRLENLPENVSNEHEAAYWVFELHNKVNKKLGKPVIPFEEAVRRNQWAFDLSTGTAKPV